MDRPLEEWLVALGSLAGTVVAITLLHLWIHREMKNGRWPLAGKLTRALSNLVGLFGLRIFLEFAPLSPKLERIFDGAGYVLTVVVLLSIIQRASTLALEWNTRADAKGDLAKEGFFPLLKKLITIFLVVVGAIMVLKRFNYDVMSLLTALGVGSLAVGLAAKETLSNMISGFTLVIDRNLRLGDTINLGGTVGDVQEIGLRSTRILVNGNILIVPNSDLVNTKILNLSLPTPEALCTSTLKTPYSTDFNRVRAIAQGVFAELSGVRRERALAIQLTSLGDGTQTMTITYWAKHLSESAQVTSDFNEKLVARMNAESLPFFRAPQIV